MKVMNDEVKARAVKFVRRSIAKGEWNDNSQYDMFSGWNGTMSPMTRAAFVETFGEAVTAEVETLAKAANDDANVRRANSHGTEYRKRATANESVRTNELHIGDFIWVYGNGLKFDHENIHRVIRENVEYLANKPSFVRDYLCRIDRIEEVPSGFFDDEHCLEGWKPHKSGFGVAYEGGACSDDIADGDIRTWNQLEQWEKDSFFTVGVLVREPNGRAVFIDPEGFSYPRYVYFRKNWEQDFESIVKRIKDEIVKTKEEAVKAKAEQDAKKRASYDEMCAKWEKYMTIVDRKAEWKDQVKTIKGNILSMAKIAAPGVRFSLRKDGYQEYTLSWTNGPTAEELKAAANFGLFVAYTTYYDAYSDYYGTQSVEFSEFAKKYGEVKDEVYFNRTEAETDRNRKVAKKSIGDEQATEGGVTITENTEKNGVEIRFAAIPSIEVRNELKSHGWRWSRFGGCWYTKASTEAVDFAKGIANKCAKSAA